MNNPIDKETDPKIIIENNPETFDRLMKLCNYYSKSFKEYNKVLQLLQSLPRVEGKVTLNEHVFSVINSYLDDYEGLNAYAHKMMTKEQTLH